MICNRVASTRATIYSLSGGLPTAIFVLYVEKFKRGMSIECHRRVNKQGSMFRKYF